MDPAFASAISKIQEQMKPLEEQIRPVVEQLDSKKKLINQLCETAGEAPLYPDVAGEKTPQAVTAAVRSDQYFGRPLATVVREILTPRKGSLGAISLDDLFDQLKAGGYDFDNRNEQIAKRNVAITLSKNPNFAKVPSTGAWGLADWYPNLRTPRKMAPALSSGGGGSSFQPIPESDAGGSVLGIESDTAEASADASKQI